MSNIQSYNALIDRFHAFASGHFILKRFSHGQIEVSDLEKFGEYPFMHVVPSNVSYAKGTKTFSFQIVLADLPRDKEDKPEYQREVLSDLQRIAEDLVAEITNHRVLFGDLITVQNVTLEPFLEEFQHTLTGWTISLDLLVPYYWDACSIPAEWNDFFESGSGGTGSILTFIDSIVRDENGNVSLVNDEATPAPNYYYGTNGAGVRGWYLTTDNIGLTCETIGDCQTIIDIEAAIDLLQQDVIDLNADVALKADITSISTVGFSNDYDDLDNKPTIPAAQVNSDWNAVSGVAEILNKPTIPTSLPPSGAAGGDLQGTYPNPTVHRVHGVDFQSGAPAVDDTWIYVSTPLGTQPFQWQHSKLKTSQVQNDSTVTGTNADDALEHLDSTKVPTTRTITINGTTQDLSANRTFTIATGLTVGTTPITSGTVGRVLFEGTGNVLQESANFFWDNTNSRLGIGTASPTYGLDVLYTSSNGTGNNAIRVLATNSAATAEFRLENNLGSSGRMFIAGSTFANYKTISANDLGFYKATSGNISILCDVTVGRILLTAGASTTAHQTIFANGNVGIGTTTDAGYKLDVNGTARMNSINGGGTSTLTVQSHVGATAALTVQFASNQSGTSLDKPIISAIGTFNPSSGAATFAGLSFTATINQTGGASGITRGLFINPTLTAAADFRAIETTRGRVVFGNLPTSSAGLPTGAIWNDAGTLKIV
jgi:hypothetical protein